MSTEMILVFAVGVFTLMSVGILLTMVEFNRLTDEPSLRKGDGHEAGTEGTAENAGVRIVHSNDQAA